MRDQLTESRCARRAAGYISRKNAPGVRVPVRFSDSIRYLSEQNVALSFAAQQHFCNK
jgi:hypothetical protein